MRHESLSEFSGVAGRLLQRVVSSSSLITGLVLGFTLLVGDWVLLLIHAPEATMPFNQIVLALALARFAANGMFGEWDGTIFSCRGGSWFAVGAIATRYLSLTALWLVPLMLIGSVPEQTAMIGPAMFTDKVILFVMLYLFLATLTPPLFLIVSVSAQSFAELFSPDHWRGQLQGRMGDLFAVYVVYTGTVGMVLALSLPPIVAAFAIHRNVGFLVGGLSFCLLFGMSVNLLGRLCGFFACGELGAAAPSVPVMAAPPAVAAVSATGSTQPIPKIAAKIPSSAEDHAEAGDRRAPLMEAKQRVEAALERYPRDPDGAISALEDMNEAFAPHPHVLEALAVCLHRRGRVEDAVHIARQALPLCFERGHSYLAAEIFREMRQRLGELDLNREQLLTIGAALAKQDDLAGAAKAYSNVIAADAGETRAIKGLLGVAERILAETPSTDASVKVYRYLMQHCATSPLAEFIREGLERAEHRLERAAEPAQAAR